MPFLISLTFDDRKCASAPIQVDVRIDFSSFKNLLSSSIFPLSQVDSSWAKLKNMVKPPAVGELVAHRMYAELLTTVRNSQVPAVRGCLLESGIDPESANQME